MRDREDECAALDRLITAVRTGQSQVLVLRGEPGIGKSVLLDYGQHGAFVEVVAQELVELGHEPWAIKTERFGATGG